MSDNTLPIQATGNANPNHMGDDPPDNLGAQVESTAVLISESTPLNDSAPLDAVASPVSEVPKRIDAANDDRSVFHSLDPRQVTVERIVGAIVWICFFCTTLLGFGIWLYAGWPPELIYWLSLAGAVLVLGFAGWVLYVLPEADHRRASWRLDGSGLEIRRGILWRREITVPRARVQHTDVQQGPIQQQYGIAKLVVHTAGTEAASVELSGLSLPIAKWLRDELIAELRGTIDAV